ncbi:MAG: ECF-type sigma factor [Acidobacteriota bacterium]
MNREPKASLQLTQLLEQWAAGDASALDRLIPLAYRRLRKVAQALMRDERRDHTLQATELVHEAYCQLALRERPRWRGREHFFAVCALVMRRLLVDHGRRRSRRTSLDLELSVRLGPDSVVRFQRSQDFESLDDAIERLADLAPRKAKVVEMKFFGGMSLDEIARVLSVSQATVVRDWRFSRAWIEKELLARISD